MALFRLRQRAQASANDPLATPKSAIAWCRALPATDTVGRVQLVTRALAKSCGAAGEISFDRVGVVEFLDQELTADRPRLLAQYVEHSTRAPPLAARLWQAGFELSQAFIAAYRGLAERAMDASADGRWKGVAPRVAGRLIHFHGVDAELRLLKNERWIPAKWVEVHRLYQRACEQGFARAALAPASASSARAEPTVEREYVAVLLINLLNTGTLAPAEVDSTVSQIHLWTAALGLDERPRNAQGFVVDVGGRAGLLRRSANETGAALRYLDTAPLVAELDRGIAVLRRGAIALAEPQRAMEIGRIATLERLRPALAPEAPKVVARHARIAANANAKVRLGLASICHEFDPSEASNGTIDFSGRYESQPREREVLGAAGIAIVPRSGVGSNEPLWRVDNRSATGFRIVAAAAHANALALGMLLAMREEGDHPWLLGVVRRLNRRTSENVEAGVSILNARLTAVTLHARRQARDDMGFVVDGVDVSTIGGRFEGLYLPPPSRPQRPLHTKTMIIPTGKYAPGRELVLITAETVYAVALREMVEQHAEWTWAVIEIACKAARD